jgi:hypothetical protein
MIRHPHDLFSDAVRLVFKRIVDISDGELRLHDPWQGRPGRLGSQASGLGFLLIVAVRFVPRKALCVLGQQPERSLIANAALGRMRLLDRPPTKWSRNVCRVRGRLFTSRAYLCLRLCDWGKHVCTIW